MKRKKEFKEIEIEIIEIGNTDVITTSDDDYTEIDPFNVF